MKKLLSLCSLVCLTTLPGVASAEVLLLDVTSDPGSIFYEYNSGAFARMDLFATSQPTNQNFRSIDDPSVQFGQGFDAFPNDAAFRFGRVEYDASIGTGPAAVTGVTFGLASDPFDNGYENWRRFDSTTAVDTFSGTVELDGGAPVAVNLEADFTVTIINPLGAETSGDYQGSFSIAGTDFQLNAAGSVMFDTLFGPTDVDLEWDFSGSLEPLTSLTGVTGDYDGDGAVSAADLQAWRDSYGAEVRGDTGADGNGDGVVDAADYPLWRNALAAAGAPAAVPEPLSLAYAALAGAIAVAARPSPIER